MDAEGEEAHACEPKVELRCLAASIIWLESATAAH